MDKKMKSNKNPLVRFRGWIQAAATLLTNIHIPNLFKGKIYQGNVKTMCVPGLNCYSCPAATGACPIGAFQAVVGSSKFKFTYYITGFFILLGVLLGRFICGFLCPFGWFQDLLHKIPGKKFSTAKLKPLRYLKYVILVVFVILLPAFVTNSLGMGDPFFCKYICPQGVLEGAIPLALANSGIRAALGHLFTFKFTILALFIILSILFYRPFCKWICPLGAIYSLFNKVSFLKIQVDHEKCVGCQKCSRVCKMDVNVVDTPNHPECIRCGECMKACPTDAICYHYGFSNKKKADNKYTKTNKIKLKRRFKLMKNKTLRTNSMKLKKVIAASLAISVLFAFTGCGSSSSTNNTNTKQESSSTTETGSADELNEKLNDLYQQENQLFADHKDAWDKVFGLMNKNAAGDAMSENYADSLASTVESNKDSFSEEEYETLCKDIETIRGIEEEIAKLEKEIAASDSSDSSSSKSDESTAVFKAFKGKDLDGNDVDDSLFAKNKVTVVNFWFSGCKPCVGELSKLNELNEKLKEMGGEVVGINTDTLDNNEAGIKEAKEILKAQGASYKNLTFDSNSTVGKYAGNIMAFPTTVLVDKDGNIIGEPFMGGIDDQSNYDQLMKQIQSVIDQK